jgi:hypothetical protein
LLPWAPDSRLARRCCDGRFEVQLLALGGLLKHLDREPKSSPRADH